MEAELLRIGVGGVVPVRWDLAKAEEEPGILTGWASVYNVIDQQDDVVLPGALAKSIADWRKTGRVIPLTLDHNNSAEGVIGSLAKAQDTPFGLKTTFKFASTDDAQRARTKAREGHLNGLSIWGGIINKSIDMVGDRPVRLLKEISLLVVGLTPFPANTSALVTATKGNPGAPVPSGPDLPDVWVSDMRAALAITAPIVRKAAVDLLVAQQYNLSSESNDPDDDEPNDQGERDVDAAQYALSLIGDVPPQPSVDDLLAGIDNVSTAHLTTDLDALAAELANR